MNELIEPFAVSTRAQWRIFIDNKKSEFFAPAECAKFFKLLKGHINIHMVIINVFQIGHVLLKDNNQVRIISDKLFANGRVSLTQIETICVSMSSKAKVTFHQILVTARNIVKYSNGIISNILWCNYVNNVLRYEYLG